jgi:hypothetical protein
MENCVLSAYVHRWRAAAFFLLFLSVRAAASFGQLVPVTPAPPGHLPPLLNECEAGPNYAACSVWIWNGSTYSAIWPNGAVGQLTVESANVQQIQVDRKDTAGPLVGMTAIYTAKWDGSTFSDGKITATLGGGTNQLTWTGGTAITPVIHNTDLNNYVNWYTSQLTAYAVYGSVFGSSVGAMIEDFRTQGETPMNPGESRIFTLRPDVAAPNFVKGASYPRDSTIAAIYANGTTFGDANVLKVMLDDRKLMIPPLTSIGSTLCTMGERSASIQEISAALNSQHSAEDAKSQVGSVMRNEAYTFVQKSLTGRTNNHLPANQAIKRTWDQLNQLRSGLAADPVKDAAGNLIVPPVTPLTCNLP